MNRIAVITPTVGRATLDGTIESVRNALGPNDVHIIIWDTLVSHNFEPVGSALGEPFIVNYPYERTGSIVGNAQRDAGVLLALNMSPKPDLLVFIDDDDEFNEDAVPALRHADPNNLHAFSMKWGPGADSVVYPTFLLNQIGGPQIVWPTDRPDILPRWHSTNEYHSDWLCVEKLLGNYPDPEMHSEVICNVRPNA